MLLAMWYDLSDVKLAEALGDITEMLEVVPRRWKVIQTVRERFSCRQCEAIAQPPAPFQSPARLRRPEPARDDPVREVRPASAAEPAKSERYACEGIDLSLSTLADQVGACATALRACTR
jgi:transposase